MSKKAAVVFVLDVGYSYLLSDEEGKKFLETSRECASMIIQSKIFSGSKDEVSLVLMGCNADNDFDGESHHNIAVAFPLVTPTWHMVRRLRNNYTDYCKANWIDAVNVAIQVLRDKSGKFSEKKVVVFSSNLKLGSLNKLAHLESGIQDEVVELILIHPKVTDDPEMDELNDEIKEANIIVEKVGGTDIDIEDAALQLLSFQKRNVKPRPWNIDLDIGSDIKIPVSGYKKINASQQMKWDNCLSSDSVSGLFPEKASSLNKESLDDNFPDSSIKVSRMTSNVRCDGKEVERSEIIEGFQFGSTIVPFTDEDKNQLNYISGPKCLSVVKITKKIYVPRHYWIDKSTICIVARDGDESDAIAFSAIVKALDHLESVAIVRRVHYNHNKPHMGALFPVIKPKKEYLVFVELPFSNCLKKLLLPALKVDHLTNRQFAVIDQLIDGMDLSAPVDDDEGESTMDRQWSDLLQPHKVFDPYLQHVRRCVASKILNPGASLPSIDQDIYKMLTEPHPTIKEAVSEHLNEISRLFPNLGTESNQRKKGRRKMDDTSKGANGENSAAAADDDEPAAKQMKEDTKSEVQKESEEPEIVGVLSPIEDFMAAVELRTTPFIKVCKQMQEVIIKLVLNSFGAVDFEKPKDSLRILRNEIMNSKMDKGELVDNFNKWMKGVHQLLQEKLKLGFWNLVMKENLGFITNEECSESNLTVTEVNEILGVGDLQTQTFSDDEEMDMPIDL